MRHINRHPTPGMRLMLVMLPFVLLLAVNGLQWWAANRHHGKERVSL